MLLGSPPSSALVATVYTVDDDRGDVVCADVLFQPQEMSESHRAAVYTPFWPCFVLVAVFQLER